MASKQTYFDEAEEQDEQVAAAGQAIDQAEDDAVRQQALNQQTQAPSQAEESPDEPQDLGDPEQERREELDREMAPLRDSHQKSIGDEATGGGTVVGSGMRLADDRSWEARYNAMQERKRAERAGLKAQSMARQELLDTGRYFDDGRGNIKLKQGERKRRERFRRGWHEETVADNGAGMRYIRKAGADARAGALGGWQDALAAQDAERAAKSREKTAAMVAANRSEMEAIKQRREEEAKNNAKGMLSIYDGLVSAYSDLNDEANKDRIERERVAAGGPRQFKKGADGKVTTEMEPQAMQETGRAFRNGYVSRGVIKSINDNLAQRGNKSFRITGIIARQQVDDVRGNVGEPTFYVQGMRWNEQEKRSVPFGRTMSMKDVYRMGVDAGTESGMDAKEAEMNVAYGFKDLFGVAKRADKANETKMSIADAANETKRKIAEVRNAATGTRRRAYTPTDYANLTKIINDPLNDDGTREEARKLRNIVGKALEGQGVSLDGAQGEAADKAEVKRSDNVVDENAESKEYPGYTNGKAQRAIAAGWKWDAAKKRFVKP